MGKHAFNRLISAPGWGPKSTSVGIYKMELSAHGKSLKYSHAIVRVTGSADNIEGINKMAESIVKQLDAGTWDGKNKISVK